MIMLHSTHFSRGVALVGCVLGLLAVLVSPVARGAEADSTSRPRSPRCRRGSARWTNGQYAQSWKDASAPFQKAVDGAKVDGPLGCGADAAGQMPAAEPGLGLGADGGPGRFRDVQKGDFVIAQFDSSFENLKYAIETVTFEKTPDGTWKAAGYYIKPGS